MIHFLQAYNSGPALRDYEKSVWDLLDPLDSVRTVPETLPPSPPTLFSYVLRYADGDTLEVRVRWNEAVYDWYPAGVFLPPPFADTAWTGNGHNRWVKRSRYPQKGERPAIYAFELVNPWPGKTIESFDLVSANDNSHDWGAPALFAVTTELRDSAAPIYWLSPDGDDDNPGTYDRPWASLKRVSHWNVSVLEPGVRVYLRGGVYRLRDNVKISTKSTADNWSLISAWPGETPIIDGMDVHKTGDDGLLLFTRGGYCRIQRLWIQNSRISGIRSWTRNISHLIYSHNVTFKTYGPGLWTTNNSKVLGNWIIRACDMDMHSDTNTWELTTIPKEKNGVREQLELGSTDSVEVAFNWICWGDKEGIDVNGGIGKWIHHNHLHDYYRKPWINGILLNSYNPRWSNIVVEYNVVHHCGLGVAVNSEGNQPVNDILIRYNLLFKNQWRGIGIGGFGQNVRVYNNTSYGNGHHGIHVGKGLHEDTSLLIRM